MTMTIFEKKALYSFGCPNREATVERLHMIILLPVVSNNSFLLVHTDIDSTGFVHAYEAKCAKYTVSKSCFIGSTTIENNHYFREFPGYKTD